MLDNVLVLSPHRDDECLGVGGTLLRCNKVHIHYFNNVHPLVEVDVYDQEAEKVAEVLGATTSYSSFKCVNRLHLFPIVHFISEIEDLINKLTPTTIFIPASSHNQDHRVVYEAAITAIRPHDTNWLVPNVLVYEQHEYMNQSFTPTVFVEIDISRKLQLFALYKSQQREHRKFEHISSLAALRGAAINKSYAEAFMGVRICPNIS